MMRMSNRGLLLLMVIMTVLGSVIAYSGEYIPEAYYHIDSNGVESERVYLRTRRSPELLNILRAKRNAAAASGASASSMSSSGSGSSSSSSGEFHPANFIDNFFKNFGPIPHPTIPSPDQFIPPNGFGSFGNGMPGMLDSLAASVQSNSGKADSNFQHFSGQPGPAIFSRSGEDVGSGIAVSGSSSGVHGSFSSSSSTVDKDGKITYSVKTGKY